MDTGRSSVINDKFDMEAHIEEATLGGTRITPMCPQKAARARCIAPRTSCALLAKATLPAPLRRAMFVRTSMRLRVISDASSIP